MNRRVLTSLLLFFAGFLVSCEKNIEHICAIEGQMTHFPYRFVPVAFSEWHWFNRNHSWKWNSKMMPDDLLDDHDYEDRVLVHVSKISRMTMAMYTLMDTKKSDAADYCIYMYQKSNPKLGSEVCEMRLSVTDVRVLLSPPVVNLGQKLTLTCKTTCDAGQNYTWFKGKDIIQKNNSNTLVIDPVSHANAGRYSCAVAEFEEYSSPEVCLFGGCTGSSRYLRPICALLGSSVDLPCTYKTLKGNVQKKYWTRLDRTNITDLRNAPEYARRVEYRWNNTHCTLRINDLKTHDSGSYKFRMKSKGNFYTSSSPSISLQVRQLHVHVRDTFPDEGEDVWVHCHTNCTHPMLGNQTLIWYKDGEPLMNPKVQGDHLLLKSVTKHHEGSYSCAVVGFENFRADPVTLKVKRYRLDLHLIVTFALPAVALLAFTAFAVLLYCTLMRRFRKKVEAIEQRESPEVYARYSNKAANEGRKEGKRKRSSAVASVFVEQIYADPDELESTYDTVYASPPRSPECEDIRQEDTYVTVYPSAQKSPVYENIRPQRQTQRPY